MVLHDWELPNYLIYLVFLCIVGITEASLNNYPEGNNINVIE